MFTHCESQTNSRQQAVIEHMAVVYPSPQRDEQADHILGLKTDWHEFKPTIRRVVAAVTAFGGYPCTFQR